MPPDARRPAPGDQPPALMRFSLNDDEFDAIRSLVKASTGISLGLHKRDLVVSRLSRRLRALGLRSFSEYLDVLENAGDGGELVEMINQITTNKTDFFRENHHFDFLANRLLPELIEQSRSTGQKKLRIWSAGCSSGEEPYSMAVTLSEFFRNHPGWDVKILATDLDTTMLQKASAGVYEPRVLAPVPKALLDRYFLKQGRGPEAPYVAKPEIRNMITFRKFNLMHPVYPFKVGLDFLFCRNVLIYFDAPTKVEILSKMHRVLKPDGHIFVGHSESLMMVKDIFSYVATTVYRKI